MAAALSHFLLQIIVLIYSLLPLPSAGTARLPDPRIRRSRRRLSATLLSQDRSSRLRNGQPASEWSGLPDALQCRTDAHFPLSEVLPESCLRLLSHPLSYRLYRPSDPQLWYLRSRRLHQHLPHLLHFPEGTQTEELQSRFRLLPELCSPDHRMLRRRRFFYLPLLLQCFRSGSLSLHADCFDALCCV